MAKIQVYKFINPGVSSIKTPSIVAARQTILAQNRFGKTLEGVGNTVLDLDKITNLRVNLEQKTLNEERKQEQRRRDREAEELQESPINEKGLSKYFNRKKRDAKKFKPNKGLEKIFEKIFGWIGPLIAPFVSIATKILALAGIKNFLEWTSDPQNIEKLQVFLEKTDFVFRKLYGFAKFIINDNLIEGITQLFDGEETLIGRIKGLGKLMTGIIGLRYLMAPWKIITDILNMLNVITGGKFKSPKTTKTSKIKPKSKFRPKVTTSKGSSTGPLKGIRDALNKFKPKKTITGIKDQTKNFIDDIGNIFKKKPKVTSSAPKGNFLTNMFKKKPTITGDTVKKSSGIVKNIKNFATKNIKNVKPGPGLLALPATMAAEWSINKITDTLIFDPMQRANNKKKEEKVNERFLNEGSEATVKFYEEQLAKENSKKGLNWWQNALTLGYGNIFVGPSKPKVQDLEYKLNYAKQITDTPQELPKINYKKDKPKKKGLFGLGFLGLEKGGKLPEFIFGGLFRAAKRVVSGVVNTVTSVAKSAWNVVSDVASNPIVSTVASFIPGANIIVPAINAVNAISSGDIGGAALSALSGISNFSAIGSTAKSVVETPNWLMNLRMSKFGQGISNAYNGATKFITGFSDKIQGFFDMAKNSTIGKIGMKVYMGNIGGAIGEVVGMMPGVGTNIEGFGNWLKKNKLEGILGAVPGLGGLASKVPNILAIPGMESILGKPGEGFSALGAIGSLADRVGMKGVYQAIMSGVQSGNFIEGLPELAAELGVDPRVLGVLDKGKQLLQNNQFNAEYAMQTAIEFIPVPLVVEKIVAAPTPVPINSGDSYIVAPSSTSGSKR